MQLGTAETGKGARWVLNYPHTPNVKQRMHPSNIIMMEMWRGNLILGGLGILTGVTIYFLSEIQKRDNSRQLPNSYIF